MNLNDRKWGIFLIGDLFCVKRPPARNKDNYEIGNVPFVASGSVNNGVMKCCKPLENEKLDKKQAVLQLAPWMEVPSINRILF